MMQKKIFWLTGLPCSGKSTIAKELSRHINAEILDGDEIRRLTSNQDFSENGRDKHIRMVAELAYILSKYTNVIVALVSPYKALREELKRKFSNIIEIYVKCSINTCIIRDTKGMYKKALNGEIKNFTGIDGIYEDPLNSTTIDTEKHGVQDCISQILEKHYQKEKKSLFIGRWQPLHEGHKMLFNKVREEGRKILIGIRETAIDENNPFSVKERIDIIHKEVPDAEIVIIPDISEVVYGRKIGYGIREIRLDKDIEKISATDLRKKINIS